MNYAGTGQPTPQIHKDFRFRLWEYPQWCDLSGEGAVVVEENEPVVRYRVA